MKNPKVSFIDYEGQAPDGLLLDPSQFKNLPSKGLYVQPESIVVTPEYDKEKKKPIEGTVGGVKIVGKDLARAKRFFDADDLEQFEDDVDALHSFTLTFKKEEAVAFVARFAAFLEFNKSEAVVLEAELAPALAFGRDFKFVVKLATKDFDGIEMEKAKERYEEWSS